MNICFLSDKCDVYKFPFRIITANSEEPDENTPNCISLSTSYNEIFTFKKWENW